MELSRSTLWRIENPEKWKAQYNRGNKSERRKKWLLENKDQLRAKQKLYKAQNRDRVRKLHRKSNLHIKYGVTVEWYDQTLLNQRNGCAICGRITKNLLSVDHNHTTGRVRGLLCVVCNTKLGVIEDLNFVTQAKNYLQGYEQ